MSSRDIRGEHLPLAASAGHGDAPKDERGHNGDFGARALSGAERHKRKLLPRGASSAIPVLIGTAATLVIGIFPLAFFALSIASSAITTP